MQVYTEESGRTDKTEFRHLLDNVQCRTSSTLCAEAACPFKVFLVVDAGVHQGVRQDRQN